MATKDWKKSGVNEWSNNRGLLIRVYMSKSDFHYLTHPAWVTIVKHERSNKYFEDMVFPTKLKAIAYAKSYMRRH